MNSDKTIHNIKKSNENTYWQEQREYFKQKIIAFKEMKKRDK